MRRRGGGLATAHEIRCLNQQLKRAADDVSILLTAQSIVVTDEAAKRQHCSLAASHKPNPLERFGERVTVLVAELTENPAIDDYRTRKAALRSQATSDSEEAAAIFAADKLAPTHKLLDAQQTPQPQQLQHYTRTVDSLLARHPDVPSSTSYSVRSRSCGASPTGHRASSEGRRSPARRLDVDDPMRSGQ